MNSKNPNQTQFAIPGIFKWKKTLSLNSFEGKLPAILSLLHYMGNLSLMSLTQEPKNK